MNHPFAAPTLLLMSEFEARKVPTSLVQLGTAPENTFARVYVPRDWKGRNVNTLKDALTVVRATYPALSIGISGSTPEAWGFHICVKEDIAL